jgi:hypothetical protein
MDSFCWACTNFPWRLVPSFHAFAVDWTKMARSQTEGLNQAEILPVIIIAAAYAKIII